ncbi:MAG: hypothetical protein UZ05_CHB002002309 [Chlorobi bacterium OLB5]|nr:MAG: hypothetical protein UZ05_CHB002002309 [Chlorobi bacterium OLB5]
MKKILLTLALTLSLVSAAAINTFAAELKSAKTEQNTDSRIYIKVYEDGAIWVYVYEQDGTFVTKYIDNEL